LLYWPYSKKFENPNYWALGHTYVYF
jgi:hypothetical protein